MLQCLGYPVVNGSDDRQVKQRRPLEFHAGIAAFGALEQGRIYHQGEPSQHGRMARERRYIEFRAPSGDAAYQQIETVLTAPLSDSAEMSVFGSKENERFESAVKRFVARSRLTNDPHAASVTMQETEVIVNELEIIRYYYTNSNTLIKAIFAGHFDADLLYSKVLSKETSEACYDGESKRHWLQYRSHFSKNDVPIIARILFDPLAMAGAQRVHRSLVRTTMRHSLKIGHARTTFPFVGAARLEVVGKWGVDRGKKVFLVDRIEQCDSPFPFKHLLALSTTAAPAPGSAQANEEDQTNSITVTGPAAQQGAMNSLALAAANSVSATWEPELRRFPNARFTIDFEQPPPKLGPGSKRYIVTNGELVETSPGGTTSGHTEAIHQSIEDGLVTGKVPGGLEAFVAVLKRLPYRVQTLAIGPSWRDPATQIDYCPFPRDRQPSRRINPFPYTDTQCKERRYYVAAEVWTWRGYHYVFDAQDRNGVSLGVLVFWSKGRKPVVIDDLEDFIMATVQHKGWAKAWGTSRGWRCKSLKHSVGNVMTDLAERIQNELIKNMFDPNY